MRGLPRPHQVPRPDELVVDAVQGCGLGGMTPSQQHLAQPDGLNTAAPPFGVSGEALCDITNSGAPGERLQRVGERPHATRSLLGPLASVEGRAWRSLAMHRRRPDPSG